jgi:hypothetical protein
MAMAMATVLEAGEMDPVLKLAAVPNSNLWRTTRRPSS